MASYLQDNQSKQQYLPQFKGGYNDESFEQKQQTLKGKKTMKKLEMQKNLLWISVSGYQVEQMGLVYRFFVDIGNVMDRFFTQSNVMYLKYASLMDCEIALSYNGQKIGYAGDILVRVRAENPLLDYKLQTVIEEKEEELEEQETVGKVAEVAKVIEESVSICVIEVEKSQQVEQLLASDALTSIVPIVPITPLKSVKRAKVRKPGFLQWLKQKVSALFYYY